MLAWSPTGHPPAEASAWDHFMQHSHYEKRGDWELFSGNPRPYLRVLMKSANNYFSFPADRIPKALSKHEFDRFVMAQGGRVAHTIALIAGGVVAGGSLASGQPLAEFLRELPHGHYFCKPDQGRWGVGAFHVEALATGLRIDGQDADPNTLERTLSSQPYLVQEWLVTSQHDLIARFNPDVINSLRLISFDSLPGPSVVLGAFRSAVTSKSVDNYTSGGAIVAIDLPHGVLAGDGFMKHSDQPLPVHPVSGIMFNGQTIPHLSEAIGLAQRLHATLRAKTLGWDIALLERGPCVLECNFPGWDYGLNGRLAPELTAMFLRLHLSGQEMSLRFEFAGDFSERDTVRKFLCNVLGRSFVSGRVEALSPENLVVTVAGSRAALDFFISSLKWPENRAQFKTARWTRRSERIRPGLDLSVSFFDERQEFPKTNADIDAPSAQAAGP